MSKMHPLIRLAEARYEKKKAATLAMYEREDAAHTATTEKMFREIVGEYTELLEGVEISGLTVVIPGDGLIADHPLNPIQLIRDDEKFQMLLVCPECSEVYVGQKRIGNLEDLGEALVEDLDDHLDEYCPLNDDYVPAGQDHANEVKLMLSSEKLPDLMPAGEVAIVQALLAIWERMGES